MLWCYFYNPLRHAKLSSFLSGQHLTASLSVENSSFSLLTGEEEKTTENWLKKISKHHLPKLITAGNAKMIVSHLNGPRSNNSNSNKFFSGPGFTLLYFILNILNFEKSFRRRQNEIARYSRQMNPRKATAYRVALEGCFGTPLAIKHLAYQPTLQKGTPITISYCDRFAFQRECLLNNMNSVSLVMWIQINITFTLHRNVWNL